MRIILTPARRLLTCVINLAAPRSPETAFFGTGADVPPKEEWDPQP